MKCLQTDRFYQNIILCVIRLLFYNFLIADTDCPALVKLLVVMETETIESMLHRLGLGEYKEAFEEQELELDLLLELSENDLKDTLRQMNLTLGKQLKICKEIRNIKLRKSIDFVQKV